MGLCFSFCLAETPLFEQNFIRQKLNIARVSNCTVLKENKMMENKIICWWSGGVTSAVACKKAIEIYGVENCRVIMIDTHNENEDTYRFLVDCEKWYRCKIETITAIGNKWGNIQDVWITRKSLNTATGAICSTELKRVVREKWEKENTFKYQVFGFEFEPKEFNRAKGMTINHPNIKAVYPLLMFGLTKKDCLQIISDAKIEVPLVYKLGYKNNNCFKTGCVQGGIGYWQKIQREDINKFNAMAEMEHYLTELKGEAVTMLKDQSKEAKSSGNWKVFLKKHKDYPNLKSINEMPPCKVEPLFECNGICGINDLIERSKTENELNYEALP
jgi:3'-phosphoadenosine 5'-phosphosulfate sulfotransferase (PAPS reductase)/FAD synthetase